MGKPKAPALLLLQLGFILLGAGWLMAFPLRGDPGLAVFESLGAGVVANMALALFGRTPL